MFFTKTNFKREQDKYLLFFVSYFQTLLVFKSYVEIFLIKMFVII